MRRVALIQAIALAVLLASAISTEGSTDVASHSRSLKQFGGKTCSSTWSSHAKNPWLDCTAQM